MDGWIDGWLDGYNAWQLAKKVERNPSCDPSKSQLHVERHKYAHSTNLLREVRKARTGGFVADVEELADIVAL